MALVATCRSWNKCSDKLMHVSNGAVTRICDARRRLLPSMFLMIFLAVMVLAYQATGHMLFASAAGPRVGKPAALGSGSTAAVQQPGVFSGLTRLRDTTACSFRQHVAQVVLDYVSLPQNISQPANYSVSSNDTIRTRRQLRAMRFKQHQSQHEQQCSKSKSRVLCASTAPANQHRRKEDPLKHFIYHLPSPAVPSAWWDACAAVSAAGLRGLQAHLDPHKCMLPDVKGSTAAHCQLGRHPWAHTFADPVLSAFVGSLFLSIGQGWAASAKQLGAPAPQLNRFDLFHAHIFIANDCDNSTTTVPQWSPKSKTSQNGSALQYFQSSSSSTQQRKHTPSSGTDGCGCSVGLLFHASEYPVYDEVAFPVMLGHCQVNSSCKYNQRAMDLRNILWWRGQLAVLDVGEASPLHDLLLHEGTEPLRTVYEEDFGKPVADLLLLQPQNFRRRRRMAAELQRWERMLQAGAAGGHSTCTSTQHHGVFVSY